MPGGQRQAELAASPSIRQVATPAPAGCDRRSPGGSCGTEPKRHKRIKPGTPHVRAFKFYVLAACAQLGE